MADGEDIRQRAQAAASAGDRLAAREAYKALAGLDTGNKGLQVEAIEGLFRAEAYPEAAEIAAAAAARFSQSPAIALAAAKALLAVERRADASDILKTLCEHKPDFTEAWEKWAIVAAMAGRYADAYVAYRGAAERHASNPRLWNKAADAAALCGNGADAERAWRESLALDPRQAVPAGQLGRLLMKRGALEEAERWLRQSIACDSSLVPAHINLAAVLLRQKRRTEALASAEEAVRLAPSRPEASTTLGQVLLDLGRNAPAANAFKRAMTLDAANPEALFGFANANARAGNFEAAVASLDRYLVLRPDDGQAVHMRRVWARDEASSSPDDYIRRLFDSVAHNFENHLEGTLSYDAPERAALLLSDLYPARDRFRSLCDVGCGTGLMAKSLASRYEIPEQVGIDLAPRMMEQARAKGFYSELIEGEAVATLAGMSRRFDLITAMDVLIYIGDGAPFLRVASERLAPSGILAVSLETSDDVADVRLQPTTRFAHNKGHFNRLAAENHLICVRDADVSLRREAGKDVQGCIVIFERK